MKHCPKCSSSRVRRGYAHDPLIVRMFGIRELLCDACNLRFRGFVFPGTLPHSNRHRRREDSQEIPKEISKSGSTKTVGRVHEAKRCPKCESEKTHRSHRQGLTEHLTSVASIYPYRCDECNHRFLAKRRKIGRAHV